jgi:hypothetical protein
MDYLNDELREEIAEMLDFTVNSGYYDAETIEELATEYLEEFFEYDYPELTSPDSEGIRKIIAEIQSQTPANTAGKNYKRLQEVFDQLNRERIIAVDFAGFDMSEGHEDVGVVFQFMKENNIPRNGYCFCHQQDIERAMSPSFQNLNLAFHSTDGDEEQALIVGKRIVELLEEAGFSVSWDGTLERRICIQNFQWDKVCDGTDVGTERAIRIINESNPS